MIAHQQTRLLRSFPCPAVSKGENWLVLVVAVILGLVSWLMSPHGFLESAARSPSLPFLTDQNQ